MQAKLTDQIERSLMEREALNQGMEQGDAGLLIGVCLTMTAFFLGIILSTTG